MTGLVKGLLNQLSTALFHGNLGWMDRVCDKLIQAGKIEASEPKLWREIAREELKLLQERKTEGTPSGD